ncbi:hypothetical protein [Thermobacillus sp.]|uniref:hypothetical protein n=1 Tax=Thermobacillus sp. TaxID=2108467 RepID=UPI002580BC1C|nr:hypothetical protein [Thermobacillus sp.]
MDNGRFARFRPFFDTVAQPFSGRREVKERFVDFVAFLKIDFNIPAHRTDTKGAAIRE